MDNEPYSSKYMSKTYLQCANITYLCIVRRIGSILLLLLFLSPFFIKIGVFSSWIINYDYIVENLCEKRDEVKNTCNGKCHLSKNLEKVDKATNEDGAESQINTSQLEYSFFTPISQTDLFNCTSLIALASRPLNRYVNQFCPHIDIPPPRLV